MRFPMKKYRLGHVGALHGMFQAPLAIATNGPCRGIVHTTSVSPHSGRWSTGFVMQLSVAFLHQLALARDAALHVGRRGSTSRCLSQGAFGHIHVGASCTVGIA